MKKTGFPSSDWTLRAQTRTRMRRTHAPSRCSYPSRQSYFLCQGSNSSSCRVCNERWMVDDGVLVVGKEWIPPGIEQVFEADAKAYGNDGVHCL